jgi:elongation factor 1-gamma
MKLYTDKANPAAWKILIAAKYAGVTIQTPNFEVGVDNKTPDFEKKSPLGKVPVLETDHGALFEPNSAARFVAKHGKTLFGSSEFQAAEVDQWIDFAATEIDLPASVWIFPILGYIPNNPLATQRAKGDIRKVLEILNTHLETKTFLVGERISLADIVVATSLHRLYEKVLDATFRKQFVNTNRWFSTIVNQAEYVAVAGQTTLATKMEVAPEEGGKGEAKPKEEKKPAEKKPAQEKKPAEKKPEKKEADEEEEEKYEDDEPKKKNPLDFLPASKLNLDEWKRVYSNEDTREKAIPWFWDHYDKEGYCLYFGDYKYNNELGKTFMTANLVTGFIQRLEKLRKYAFGCILIFGTDGDNEITSFWLFRGKDIPQEMIECDDSEHYNWTRVDNYEDPAVREKINDYLAWDGKFGGKTKSFVEGKAFK